MAHYFRAAMLVRHLPTKKRLHPDFGSGQSANVERRDTPRPAEGTAMPDHLYSDPPQGSPGNLATDPGQNEHVDDTSSMLDAALLYAKNGLPIFPAVRGDKKSHKSAKYSNGVNWGAPHARQRARLGSERSSN